MRENVDVLLYGREENRFGKNFILAEIPFLIKKNFRFPLHSKGPGISINPSNIAYFNGGGKEDRFNNDFVNN
ncbi:hypothetical protein BN1002_00877 [Bacillus sp. B-jedd]|nr:hypothetical protein BN1002_00877 [Bacillus sp. B-jedd]